MTAFLSEDWLQVAAAELADVPAVDEIDTVVQYIVSGGPDGKVQIHVTVESGRVSSIGAGKHHDPVCSVTLTYNDARALFRGELSPDVAFMSGRVKVEGDHRVWLLDLRPLRRDPEVRAAVGRIRDATSA